jgi:hypothetical protein
VGGINGGGTMNSVGVAFIPACSELVELAFRPASRRLNHDGALAPQISSAEADPRYRNLGGDADLKIGSTGVRRKAALKDGSIQGVAR